MSHQLLFDFIDTRYAVPADAIDCAYWLPALATAPDLPGYFSGLMNVRGDIMPVVDLARRFGRTTQACRADQSVLVLRDGAKAVGILADSIVDLAELPDERMEPYFQVEGTQPFYNPSVIRGCIEWQDRIVILLDAGALLQLMFDVTEATFPQGFIATEGTSPAELELLRERARQLASPLAVAEEMPDWFAFVLINESRFAIDLRRVNEFAHLGHYTPVPCCPEHILGCINLRGSIITVLDVAPILLGTPSRDCREVVILELGGQRVAVAVQEVTDVSAFPTSATIELSGHAFGHPHARHLLRYGETVAEVLDLDVLLREGLLEVKEQV
jgi:purine-binding chemotaxis protein CheW